MNKQQLAAKIWESANRMRSKIEANEYKDYILGFIFYKHRNLKIYVNRNRAKSALFFINPPADLQRVVKNLENTPSAPYALLLSLDLALLQMYNYYVNYVYM